MMRCYVVDDEAHALEVLVRYVQQTPGLELAGAEENPLVALHAITGGTITPEITFVDVDMPQLSGVDLAEFIHPYTEVVFTTAFPDYALQAFEKNVVDYLLKPVPYERFLKSVHKVREKLTAKAGRTKAYQETDYIFIKGDMKGKVVRVVLHDILYIEALQNYIKIHVQDGTHLTYLTMKEIEENLPAARFSRVHKSYIVNNMRVKTVEGNQIMLENNSTVGLGASYRDTFLGSINAKLVKSRRIP